MVERVLAIAVGVIEADSFWRVAEPIGLLFGIEIDDRNVLVHRTAILLVAADGDVQVFVAFGFAQVGGDEAVQNISFTHKFTHNCQSGKQVAQRATSRVSLSRCIYKI